MFRSDTLVGQATAVAVLFLTIVATGTSADPAVRIALSDTLFSDLNENDAHAAVNAWAKSLSESTHLQVDGGPQLMNSDQIDRAIANHLVDAFSITTAEYVRIAPYVDATIIMDEDTVKQGLEYLLLIRRDSGVTDLAGLHGRNLIVCQGPSMNLALPWLETLLGTAKLESTDRFFGHVKVAAKTSVAVLPVFFGSADSALVTHRAYDLMCELNPQLRQKLLILATSPRVRTAFFAIHKDISEDVKSRIRKALTGYYDTPNGRQTLTLFQSGRLIAADTSILRGSVDLLANYERLKERRPGGAR